MKKFNRHICGSPYSKEHCKYLKYIQTDVEKLDKYCVYCLAGKRPKKISCMASWTGLTPKWCPKIKDNNNDTP